MYTPGLVEYKKKVDVLNLDDIIWTPYAYHRVRQEFDDTSLFQLYMMGDLSGLSERCMPQFGYMSRTSHEQSLLCQLRVLTNVLWVKLSVMLVPLQINQWRFSSMRKIWMVTQSGTLLYHTLTSFHQLSIQIMLDLSMLWPSGDMPSPPSGVADQKHMQMISVIMDNLMCLINLDNKVYALASQTIHITSGRHVQILLLFLYYFYYYSDIYTMQFIR